MNSKMVCTAIGAVIFAVVALALFAGFGASIGAPEASQNAPAVSFSQALWSDYAWAAVVIGTIIFAGAVGVIKLVGGGFKWR